jgi:hypothetical protein
MAFPRRQTGPNSAGFGRVLRASERIEAWLEADRTQSPLLLPIGVVAGIGTWLWLTSPAAWAGFLLTMAAIASGSCWRRAALT